MTRRRVAATAVVTLVLVLGATAVVLVRPQGELRSLVDVPRLVAPPECLVGDVELDRDQADRAARAVAQARREGRPARPALTGVVPQADAAVVARALSGRTPTALTCRAETRPESDDPALLPNGLTARADGVRRDVRSAFGALPMGGYAPGGVSTGHRPGSAHYEGRAVDIFFRPVSSAAKVRGWALAHYLVARADHLGVETVIFDGHIWSRWRSDQRWRAYSPDVGDASRRTQQILEHRDHVHVDVG